MTFYGHELAQEFLNREKPAPPQAEAIARKFVGMGAHVIFFPRGTKACKKAGWEQTATNDLETALDWAAQDPSANVGLVGKQNGVWGLDDDAGLVSEYEKIHGPLTTYGTHTVSGGRHFIFKQNAASWEMGNVSVENESGQELLSARVNNRYVVAAGSWAYPHNNESQPLTQYSAINPAALIEEAPQSLLDFIKTKAAEWKTKKQKSKTPIGQDVQIREGGRNNYLTSRGGKLREAGAQYDSILTELLRKNLSDCVPPLPDGEVEQIAKSVSKYPEGAPPIAFTQNKDKNESAPARILNFVRGDSVKPVRLKWLWKNRILANKLNVFSGEPEVGKGMTSVDFAARITRHWDFPDCKNELDGPRDVLFLSSEDDMEDTIVPRLKVAGTDMSRIHFAEISENSSGTLTEGLVCLDRDLPVMEEMIKRYPNIVLIIPDPVIAFLGDADPNKDKEVRPIYSMMKTFAKRLNVAWLFVNHWNKNQNATSINRTSGAKTMVSAPRATWMFAKSPEDPDRYLMMRGKGNLSSVSSTKTLAYRIVGVPYDFQDGKPAGEVPKLMWDGETEHSTEQVLQEQADPESRRDGKAEALLEKLLELGAVKARDIYLAADKERLSTDKMKRARYRLGYAAGQISGVWYWAKSNEDIQTEMARQYKAATVTLNQPVTEQVV
jgi:hypothetical protein